MSEALVVNLFLWVRVFLVGGIFIMYPRITRKGLLFGVYVGEEFSEGDFIVGVDERDHLKAEQDVLILNGRLDTAIPNPKIVRRRRDRNPLTSLNCAFSIVRCEDGRP